MSRKKSLSPTASLASCLDFAARVLSSTATVQEICTKSVLAPMVVDAHRFGQQVMKNLEPDTPADVRRLLRILQEQHNKKLCREAPIDRLDVADLTWDFEGPVADTLEMELEELRNRAAMDATDTCVVFSAFSQSSGGGQAVIWFPHENNEAVRDEDERKKRQILLYVCPGRVKIVKSVGDLIKKMYDELAILREYGAAYNVWAVILRSRSHNQSEIDKLAKSQDDNNNQCEVESILKASSSPIDSTVATTYQAHTTTVSTEFKTSRVSANQDELPTDRNDAVTQPQDGDLDSDELSSVSPHFSVYHEVTDPNKSIFSFGLPQKASTELQRKLSEPAFDGVEVGERGVESNTKPDDAKVKEDANAINAEDEVRLRRDIQQQVIQPKRAIISASLTDFSNGENQRSLKTEVGPGLGIPLQQGLVWQSCDGKVLRRSMCSLHKPLHHDGNTSTCKYVNKPPEVKQAEREGREELSRQITVQTDQSADNNSAPSPRIFKIGYEPNANQAEGDTQTNVDFPPSVLEAPKLCSSVEMANTVAVVEDFTSFESERTGDDVSRSLQLKVPGSDKEDMAKANSSGLSSETEKFPPEQKTKHAPVNYKDKLGARVWWEIEYIARKLELEEMIGRQQQAFQWQVNNQVNQGHRSTTEQNADSRTVWSTKGRTMKRKETPTGADHTVSGDQRILNELNPTAALEPGKNQENYSNRLVLSSLRKEGGAPVIDATQPNDHKSTDNSQMKTSQDNKNQEGSTDLELAKKVEISRLSTESTKSEKHYTAVRISAEQKVQKLRQALKECPKPAISPAISLSNVNKSDECGLNKSHERSQPSRSAERESVKSPFVRSREFTESPITNTTNQGEDDGETMAQEMWGSTHTSYERHHITNIQALNREDEVQTTEVALALPFNIRGRVPVRSRKISSRTTTPATDEPPISSSTNGISSAHSPPRNNIPSKETKPSAPKPSEQAILHVAPTQPPVATFIALHEDNTTDHTTKSAKTRQERLKELRQKKLQKLQQTRDMSLQQQKEKQDQRNRPHFFANSVYSKASNRQLMQNALEFTLLAGGSMERERTLALQALAESAGDNFIVLLKSAKELQFRALYENHVERNSATRIFSVLPSNSSRAPLKLENSEMISQFFKYSSAKKQFLPVPTRCFTVKTDACALVDQLVFKGKSKNNRSALAQLL